MGGGIEEKRSAGRMTSPEQLNDYLKVTSPKVWILLVAVMLLAGGLLVWASFTTVESYATGTARAESGQLTVVFDDPVKASKVSAGMEMEVGDVKAEVLAVGHDANEQVVASAQAAIPDGVYEVRVGYNPTQVISMLFN